MAIDADTIRLSYSKTDDAVLSLEMKGPGDANYRMMSHSLNQALGNHTLAGEVDSQIFAAAYVTGYGFSLYSNFLATDGVPDAPVAPGNPRLHMADQDDVRLIWNNVPNNEKGYRIERKLHGAYSGPEWHDGNLNGKIDAGTTTPFSNGTIDSDAGTPGNTADDERRYPIAYERSVPGTPKLIGADFALNFGGAAGTGWKVKASGGGFTFAEVTLGAGSVTGTVTSTEALPETIDSRKLKITWQMSLDGGTNWFTVGETENHLYVTGAAVTSAFETVVHLGSEGAKGKRPRNAGEADPAATNHDREVVDGVWGKFENRDTERVDGTAMTYWAGPAAAQPALPQFQTLPELLSSADGRCSAWADLFIAAVGVHGITAHHVGVIPAYASISVGGNTLAVDGFVVRSTLPAQGNLTPPTAFQDHAVVSVGNTIYDPSYGVKIAETSLAVSAAAWDLAAVRTLVVEGIPYPDDVLPQRLTKMIVNGIVY